MWLVHDYNSSTQGLMQAGQEFQASQGYVASSCVERKRNKVIVPWAGVVKEGLGFLEQTGKGHLCCPLEMVPVTHVMLPCPFCSPTEGPSVECPTDQHSGTIQPQRQPQYRGHL